MGAPLFSHFRVTNVKLINEKKSLIIAVSKRHGLRHSITFFVFSLLCCKYICDIYLSMLDFNGLPIQVQQHIFFLLGFLSRTFTIHRTAEEGGGCQFNSSLPLPPASQTHRH